MTIDFLASNVTYLKGDFMEFVWLFFMLVAISFGFFSALCSERGKEIVDSRNRVLNQTPAMTLQKSEIIKTKKHTPNTKPKPIPKQVNSDNIKFIDYDTAKDMVMDYYREWGYTRTLQYLRQLNSNGDIALRQRCRLQDIITELYLTPTSRSLKRRFNKSVI